MSKSAHERSAEDTSLAFNPALDASALLGAQRAMIEASRALSDVWTRSARDFMTETSGLTARLAECRSPADVPSTYGKWIEARLKRFAADGQDAMEIWQDAVKTALANGDTDGEGAGKRDRST